MTPLPKRKFSHARTGRRLQAREKETTFASLIECKNCGKKKLPHQRCKYCNK